MKQKNFKELGPEELLCKIAEILEKLKIPYIITGGFAVAIWGRPRFTADIDIVVELFQRDIDALCKELLLIDKDVYVDKEGIKDALLQKGEFNFIHPQTGLKVDFWISKRDEFDKLRIKRKIIKRINSQKINFISPEDLILVKLSWYRENGSQKQLEDIKSILDISKVDLSYIKKWARQQSTITILDKILKNN